MPANKKQHTTPLPSPTAEESASCQHQVEQSFHQRLREQIRSATQRVMEEIMCEELTQFLGAEWGECCAGCTGYRNGSYTRDLATTSGQIEDLHHRNQLRDHCMGRHAGDSFAQNSSQLKDEH